MASHEQSLHQLPWVPGQNITGHGRVIHTTDVYSSWFWGLGIRDRRASVSCSSEHSLPGLWMAVFSLRLPMVRARVYCPPSAPLRVLCPSREAHLQSLCTFSLQGACVQSLVRELRFQMLHGTARKHIFLQTSYGHQAFSCQHREASKKRGRV